MNESVLLHVYIEPICQVAVRSTEWNVIFNIFNVTTCVV